MSSYNSVEPRHRLGITPASVIVFASTAITIGLLHRYINLGEHNSIKFDRHPLLLTWAFVVCMFQGVITWRVVPGTHSQRKVVHVVFQTAAAVLASVGIWNIWSFKYDNAYPNMKSVHDWFGMVGIVMFGVQYLGGAIVFFFAPAPVRAFFLEYHRFGGRVLTGWLAATIIMGALGRQLITNSEHAELHTGTGFGLMVGFTAIFVSYLWSPNSGLSNKEEDDTHRPLMSSAD